MKKLAFLAGAAAAVFAAAVPATANDRYATRPPVVVSPDLAAPWIIQLGRKPGVLVSRQTRQQVQPSIFSERRVNRPEAQPDRVQTAAVAPMYTRAEMQRKMDPKYLPQQVAYDGPGKPGSIVIDSHNKFLYLVEEGGQARRYGVGVGKEGFGWTGTHNISRKAVWPDWRPPAEMIERERAKGRILPAHMPGGPDNPLGARALYLGDTLYRIHGTNAPWTIGTNASSGCIRMRNEDVVDLFERVKVGTQVTVL
ncbi:MAG TPA: L,D-transpeptidase [Rhizobiales bacterium]|nr:L,D-transpeptidase [Hyphomicrobiales bacterium]